MAITKVTSSVLSSGSATDGYVLTADGSGNSAWEAAAGGASSINDLTDAKTFGTGSIMLGDTTTGTLSNANYNVGVGVDMLNSLTSGYANIAIGFESCKDLTTGHNNVAVGHATLYENIGGEQNVAIGANALQNNTSGNYNTAVGKSALVANTTASNNTAVGYFALVANTTATDNVAVGTLALRDNTTGSQNTAVGRYAAQNVTTGTFNTVVGYEALDTATSAHYNTTIGVYSGRDTTSGSYNTFLGAHSGNSNTTGVDNVYIGYSTGSYSIPMTTGSNNTVIGAYSRPSANNGTNQIVLGRNIVGAGNSTFRVGAASNTATLTLNGGAVTFSVSSDERLKENIVDSTVGLNFINDLRPVTYKWKAEKDVPTDMSYYKEGSDKPCKGFGKTNYGFIAQEVKSTIDNYSLADGQNIHRVDTDGTQELAPAELVPMLVKAIQELSEEVEKLKLQLGD
jgi:hypothetical protein